nr:MFS transporter [Advenella incenata]
MIPQTVFSRYVSSVFEVSHTTTGIAYGALALGFIISAPLWARIFENESLRGTLVKLLFIVFGCGLVVIVAAVTRNVDVFIGLYVVWGILLGGTQPIVVATISRIANRTNQGVVLGVSQSVSQFSSISGIALGAMFGQMYGLEKTYFFVFSAYLLTSIFIGITARYLPKRLAFMSDDRFN